jgi:hypothetical protein
LRFRSFLFACVVVLCCAVCVTHHPQSSPLAIINGSVQ